MDRITCPHSPHRTCNGGLNSCLACPKHTPQTRYTVITWLLGLLMALAFLAMLAGCTKGSRWVDSNYIYYDKDSVIVVIHRFNGNHRIIDLRQSCFAFDTVRVKDKRQQIDSLKNHRSLIPAP